MAIAILVSMILGLLVGIVVGWTCGEYSLREEWLQQGWGRWTINPRTGDRKFVGSTEPR